MSASDGNFRMIDLSRCNAAERVISLNTVMLERVEPRARAPDER